MALLSEGKHRSSKPRKGAERPPWRVRFPCSTERLAGRNPSESIGDGHQVVTKGDGQQQNGLSGRYGAGAIPTPGQFRVLRGIANYAAANGFPPSTRDLMAVLGFESTNAVVTHVRALEAKGCVTTRPGTARSLLVTDIGFRWLEAQP